VTSTGKLIFLIAGEPSGDTIGGRLMAALRVRSGGDIRFAGVGGPAMTAEGLDSLFAMSELAVMGVVEVLPRAPRLLRRMRQTAAAIRAQQPAAVVSIDAPAFCFGVWRRLRGAGIPLIHYVAPTVWAWRPGRARKYARAIDHLLALLPFEPPYFEREGLGCTFVGHPVLESGADAADGAGFRARHGLGDHGPVLGILPGSRRGEVVRLMPHFGAAVTRLADRFPGLEVVIPAPPALASEIEAASRAWPVRALVTTETETKFDAMAACDTAIAASGTVALELALAGVPMVIGYRLNPVTLALVKRMIRVKYANLINLLLDRPAVPELLQGDCRGETLADAAARLLDSESARTDQRVAAREALAMLSAGDVAPSDRAAGIVLDLIEGAGHVGETATGEAR
jgi:lipid-A-disaccharide synthase